MATFLGPTSRIDVLSELHQCWNNGKPHIVLENGGDGEEISCRGALFILPVSLEGSAQDRLTGLEPGGASVYRIVREAVMTSLEIGVDSMKRRLREVALYN